MNEFCLAVNPLNLLAILIGIMAITATVLLACAAICFGMGKDE